MRHMGNRTFPGKQVQPEVRKRKEPGLFSRSSCRKRKIHTNCPRMARGKSAVVTFLVPQ